MQHRKPQWWQLFALVPLMFALLALEHLAPVPGVSDTVADAGIVVLTFVAMLGWVHLNEGLLEWYYGERDEASSDLKITVYEPASKKQNGKGHSEDSSLAVTLNGSGEGASDTVVRALPPHSVRLYRPQRALKKEKNKWHRN